MPPSTLSFDSLNACAHLAHAFLCRPDTTNICAPKDEAIQLLAPFYRAEIQRLGFPWSQLQTAEQTHGTELAVIRQPTGGLQALPIVDGLLTNQPGVLLGIMAADCCAVYLVDPVQQALALLHSGKRGTEGNIVGKAIRTMAEHFGSLPKDLIVQLSPCIRPPHYEVDIAPTIQSQAAQAGVPTTSIHDEGLCTASDPERFYSYRRDKGFTGRHLALLGYPTLTTT